MISLSFPMKKDDALALKAGDSVLLSGILYTARDAAHKRLCEMLERGEELPFDLTDACIYYTGPCPATPNEVIGPCGPTTASRMDAYTPRLLEKGLRAMIGKGARGEPVKQSIKEHGALYFAVTGGVAILIAQRVLAAEPVAFEDLGSEAILKLTVEELPAIVAVDAHGNDLFARE